MITAWHVLIAFLAGIACGAAGMWKVFEHENREIAKTLDKANEALGAIADDYADEPQVELAAVRAEGVMEGFVEGYIRAHERIGAGPIERDGWYGKELAKEAVESRKAGKEGERG